MEIKVPGVYAKKYLSKRTGQMTVYYFHRATGTRLPDDPLSPEFGTKLADLRNAPPVAAPARQLEGTLGAVIDAYKASEGYADLAASTKSEYERHMRYLEKLRDQPVAGFTAMSAEA